MKKLLSIALGITILTSCSTSNEMASSKTFQKRKYTKGWYKNSTKKFDKSVKSNNENVARKESKYTPQTEVEAKVAVTSDNTVDHPVAHIQTNAPASNFVASKGASELEIVQNHIKYGSRNNHNAPLVTSAPEIMNEMEVIAPQDQVQTLAPATTDESTKSSSDDDMLILLYILAVLIPFVAVGIVTDWELKKVLINILLTIFTCGIGGIIHAFIMIRDYY